MCLELRWQVFVNQLYELIHLQGHFGGLGEGIGNVLVPLQHDVGHHHHLTWH